MRSLVFIVFTISCFFMIGISSCSKTPPQAPVTPPPDSIPDSNSHEIPDFTVTNEWQCDIDGVAYSGTIDTSFIQVIDSDYYPDTLITCVGTSHDKKANILFAFYRNTERNVNTHDNATLFDTVSPQLLIASYHHGQGAGAGVDYDIDSFRYDKVKAHFSGYLYSGYPVVKHTISNGKLSCRFNKGNDQPNKFSYNMSMGDVTGYFNSALIVSNTLMLDGQLYRGRGEENIRLQVRTGEDIRPGVYKSTEGNVGFYYHVPNTNWQYVDDDYGDLTVTINTVDNGIVTGSFSGIDATGDRVNNGIFKCRIKNYRQVRDSANQWNFNTRYNFEDYRMYGGNVMKSTLTQRNGRYLLIIKGNSDFGASAFKMQVSSRSPITTGTYTFPNGLDSFYFSSNEAILNGGAIYLGSSKTMVTIDKIDQFNVSGTIDGGSQGAPEPGIKTGAFTGSF